ncbi:hypothetical protein FE257_003634 [Aspergillus nanangensis]|uniref:T6SS Phospholipase effector Tle1-like catalytic domain-containing protein n=1 Tax=Aspergillus nanangensis TaxID=2582783 RepID=A0AAD4CSI0_ASPNN|nr:hypothetical protein FE257_003634 [Aspergillus nanangensis]
MSESSDSKRNSNSHSSSRTTDCGCPPTRELVLCFDGTGNTFRADGGESNILKIFRMLDRTRDNRFCYYQPGIGTTLTAGSFANAFNPFRSLPTTKVFDQALATSFDQHVIGGYRFIARRWEPGAKIYLFGFSRGAYTARFLNEMLDFAGLISADNEEIIPFVWEAFVKYKFSDKGQERQRTNAELHVCRDTMCRSVGYVHFLGLFDTVNSVAEFNDDVNKDTRIQPNPKIMRHAVSIDERRIKFQPVLFQEARSLTQKKTMGRISTWDAQAEAVLAAEAEGGVMAKDSGNGGAVNLDPELNDNFEEVYFAGDHSDVGGGWPADRWAASQIPLMWMIQEATRAGLTFHDEQLQRLGCFDPSEETYDAEIVQIAEKAVLHDSLDYSGGKGLDTLFWRLLEWFPFQRLTVQPDGSFKKTRWHFKGLHRPLPPEARIHGSVIRRVLSDPKYRPYNLGFGKTPTEMDEERELAAWKNVLKKGLLSDYWVKNRGMYRDRVGDAK